MSDPADGNHGIGQAEPSWQNRVYSIMMQFLQHPNVLLGLKSKWSAHLQRCWHTGHSRGIFGLQKWKYFSFVSDKSWDQLVWSQFWHYWQQTLLGSTSAQWHWEEVVPAGGQSDARVTPQRHKSSSLKNTGIPGDHPVMSWLPRTQNTQLPAPSCIWSKMLKASSSKA